MIRFKCLDVRPLFARGEEPCGAIDASITALGPDEGLTVIAPFLPAPLVEKLKAAGFSSQIERRPDGAWAVRFWRE